MKFEEILLLVILMENFFNEWKFGWTNRILNCYTELRQSIILLLLLLNLYAIFMYLHLQMTESVRYQGQV